MNLTDYFKYKAIAGGGGVTPTGEIDITANGNYDVANYATAEVAVPTAGASDVTFYDYDGSIVDSYSAAEFAELESMPENPTHEGLTAQGWNWSLSDAKAQVASSGKLDIGQVYAGTPIDQGVTFYDYDGTILHNYTLAQFAALESMPENPTHTGLTSQGWNWSLSDAKAYAAAYGKLNIGQMYVTTSGKTELSIELVDGALSPRLGLCLNGTAEIDWNDNSEIDTITGTSVSTPVYKQHTYSSSGVYTVKIDIIEGDASISGNIAYGSYLLSKNNANGHNNDVYRTKIRSIKIGNATNIANYAFAFCYGLKTVTIPRGVTSIGNSAFSRCATLESITLPDGVTGVGSDIASACGVLKSIIIPKTLSNIGGGFATGCYSLESITIPSGVTSIGNNAFQDCDCLKTVTIPSGVASIGDTAFSNCDSLENVEMPSGVTSIGTSVFTACKSLRSLTISDSITDITSGFCSSCDSLATVMIPSGVTSIGSSAFSANYSLAKVVIPSGVTSIGSYAFAYCYVSEYHFEPTTPPSLAATNAFSGISSDCVMYVPYSADHSVLEAYKTATNWATYASYMQEEPQP